jgi:hypothetical protein
LPAILFARDAGFRFNLLYEIASFHRADPSGIFPRVLCWSGSRTEFESIFRGWGNRSILATAAGSAGPWNEVGGNADFACGLCGIRPREQATARNRRH